MEKKKVYILFSHFHQDSDYTINIATVDLTKVFDLCMEYGFNEYYEEEKDEPFTLEVLQHNNYVDFGYDCVEGSRTIFCAFDIEVPDDKIMYAVIANGDEEYSWEAEMVGIYTLRDKAVNAIVKELKKLTYDLDEIAEYRESLSSEDSITDMNFTNWSILQFVID